MTRPLRERVGLVAIGRNEGERLRRCLTAATRELSHVVYVDSGSTDGSLAMAVSMGVEGVELDMTQPFTAARARNAGWRRLVERAPGVEFVQFVDGDCELEPGYLERAVRAMEQYPGAAVISGRRRERHRGASVYNRLIDMEWDTPVGVVNACHGDATVRLSALREVEGFREDMIAGEEPEMCVRLRRSGWAIRRIDAPMTIHDADMHRFGQWWKRAVRAGHAYAEGFALHGRSPQRHNAQAVRSILTWGLMVPLLTLGVAVVWPWALLWAVGLYALLGMKLLNWRRRRGDPLNDAALYAALALLGKFANLRGLATYAWRRATGGQRVLIEYKGAASSASPPDA